MEEVPYESHSSHLSPSTTLQIVLYVSSNQEKQRSIPYHALSPTPFIEHSEILNLSI